MIDIKSSKSVKTMDTPSTSYLNGAQYGIKFAYFYLHRNKLKMFPIV